MRMNIFRDFIVEHRKLKIEILFPVASIGNQSMRINILFSYIVMNTRGRGEPMHHQPITISKGGIYASSSNTDTSMETEGKTTQHRTN